MESQSESGSLTRKMNGDTTQYYRRSFASWIYEEKKIVEEGRLTPELNITIIMKNCVRKFNLQLYVSNNLLGARNARCN